MSQPTGPKGPMSRPTGTESADGPNATANAFKT